MTGLRWWPAISAILRPTAVEPVKLILRTCGAAISACVTSAADSREWPSRPSTPLGSPARRKTSTHSWCVRGESSDNLKITALPAARG